jgi:hypothetical protein
VVAFDVIDDFDAGVGGVITAAILKRVGFDSAVSPTFGESQKGPAPVLFTRAPPNRAYRNQAGT